MNDLKINPDTPLTDTDYVLTEGAGWFRVKGFAIRIHSTDEGVIVDIFKDGEYTDTIATTYAFDHEIMEQE
jgi:hypothetical protein